MALRIRKKKDINIGKVVTKVVATVIALYVGGTIMTELGSVLNCTSSPFYQGLSLIGWTIATVTSNGSTYTGTCSQASWASTAGTYSATITSVAGTGVLAVIGIIALATIVTEFIEFSM